jgi:hypothetical protein
MKRARLISLLTAVLLFGLGAANAGTITAVGAGWTTSSAVTGTAFGANSTVNITFKTTSGLVSGTTIATADGAGNFTIGLPIGVGVGDTIFFSGTEATGKIDTNKAGGVVAYVNGLPNGKTVVDVTTIGSGSSLVVGTTVLSLTGGFASVETAYNNNPASPHYGDLSFLLLTSGFHVYSTNAPLTISLASNTAFTLNLIPFLNDVAAGNFTGTTVPVDLPIDLNIVYGGTSYAATGVVTGFSTTLPGDLADPSTLDLSLTSALGPISGTLYATSDDIVTPEPPSALLFLSGLGLLLLAGFRAKRASWL